MGTPITATDQDGGTISYSMSGTNAGSFTINLTTGQISTKSDNKYDFETKSSYEVTVTANDGQEQPEGTKSIAVTINITDVEEPPVKMATPTFSDTGRYETTVKWAKPNNTGRPAITKYQLLYGKNVTNSTLTEADAGTGVKNTVDDLDDGQEYRFQVRAKNAEGESPWSDAGTISTPANRLPVFTEGATASRSLPENSPEDTNVGNPIAATDQDDDTREYSITGTNSGKFTVSPATGQLLAGEHDYDHETTILLRADAQGKRRASTERTRYPSPVTITDVEEKPGDPQRHPPSPPGTAPRTLNDLLGMPRATPAPPSTDYDLQYQKSGQLRRVGLRMEPHPEHLRYPTIITGLIAGQTYHVQVKAKSPEGESELVPPAAPGRHQPQQPTDLSPTTGAAERLPAPYGRRWEMRRTPEGTVGTAVTATDTDWTALHHLQPGGVADAGSFSIQPLDHRPDQHQERPGPTTTRPKSSYSVTVTANDGQEEPDNTKTIAVTISVTDEEEPPVEDGSPPTFSETGRYETTPAWTAPPNTGRPAITGYELRYGTGTDTSTHQTKDAGSSLSLTVESLEDGETYNFQVRAENAEGWGPVVGVRRRHHPGQPGPHLHSRHHQPHASRRIRQEGTPTPAITGRGHRRRQRQPHLLRHREPTPGQIHGESLGNRTDQSRQTTTTTTRPPSKSYALTLKSGGRPRRRRHHHAVTGSTSPTSAEPPAKPEPAHGQPAIPHQPDLRSGRSPSQHRSRHNRRLRRPVDRKGTSGDLDRCGRHGTG